MKECPFCSVLNSYKKSNYPYPDEILFVDDFWWVKFDVYPSNPGHILVIPSRHVDRFEQLNAEEQKSLGPVIAKAIDKLKDLDLELIYRSFYGYCKKSNSEGLLYCSPRQISEIETFFGNRNPVCLTERAIKKLKQWNRRPEGYTVGINDGDAAGRQVKHLHVHLIPRYFGDTKHSEYGILCVIPETKDYMHVCK